MTEYVNFPQTEWVVVDEKSFYDEYSDSLIHAFCMKTGEVRKDNEYVSDILKWNAVKEVPHGY